MAAAPVLPDTQPAAPDTAVVVPPPVRTPGYYVRQRLWANRPAVAGLVFIGLCALVALLGYWVLPDPSPNANNGFVQLQKQPPGFTANFIRHTTTDSMRRATSFVTEWWRGQPAVAEMPIDWAEEVDVPNGTDSLLVYPWTATGNRTAQPINLVLKDWTGNFQDFPEVSWEKRTYWLGTDKAGRDELSRLLLGTRISLGIGLVAVLISLVIGVAVGAVAGYFGGWVDSVLLGLMTVVWSIPGIMLVIGISLALDSKGVWVSFVAVGLTMWVDVARVVRGQVLGLRSATFIEAGRVLGLPTSRLIFVHLLPNLRGPLIVLATSNFAAAILLEAGLSFLGLGVQPPAPSWGLMVKEGYDLLGTQAGLWLTLLPGLAISLLVLSFNVLGNGLRDAFDPKTQLT
ncbi:ABC transporter permease [Hymenobacter cheonanensis]|uniref:ABC transporter permease n=1 Tax=Hymenobacter sp. CA2-7 TaxID=3063993 RepID=UPI0027126074|nr:ABC transporter permease [Hymenobacter sp. CA2-7]MDO7887889.1 ABC transporter permease [Hymenobacter sp. CA2-7]